MQEKQIAVVILNWNGSKMLEDFLPSVVEYSDEAHVVVADNGSTDDSLQMLTEKFPMVRQICLDSNYGFAEGYNKAISQIEEPYVLLLNSDVEVTPHWLKPLLDFMNSHKDVAACQPKVRAFRHKEQFEYAGACGGFIDYLGYPFCRGRLLGTVETDKGQYDEPIEIFWATGAALLVRTDIYKATGGLDARFFAHMEEIDFCWRLNSRGYKLACVPQSLVYHVGGATLNKSNPRKTYLNFRNNLFMIYKNTPEAKLSKVLAIRKCLDYVAWLQMVVTGKWKDAQAVLQARKEFCSRKSEFESSRQSNLNATCVDSFPTMMEKSLLAQYYIKGRKHFSQLPIKDKNN